MGHYQLDALDIQILRMVANNARIPYLEVARECNVSGAAIHQRIQKMMSLGVLSGSEFKLNPTKIGLETCAFVGLYLKEPSEFDRVVEALEQIPEVVECHYTTGKYDLFIKMYVKGNAELKDVIHDKLLPLGLARTETLISFNEVFRRQMPIPDADCCLYYNSGDTVLCVAAVFLCAILLAGVIPYLPPPKPLFS